jgi:hypothetical protein
LMFGKFNDRRPHPHPLRPMCTYLYVRRLHRRNRHLSGSINGS